MPYVSSHYITHSSYILPAELYLQTRSKESVTSITQWGRGCWGLGGRGSDLRETSCTSRSFGAIQATHAMLCTLSRKFEPASQFDIMGLVLENKNKNLTHSRTAQNCNTITTRFLPLFILPFHFY